MAKKHVHYAWGKIRPLSPWYLLALSLVFGTISVYSMRQNNLHMLKLRNDVFKADQQNKDVETALRNLREYIYSHMNTNLNTDSSVKPPIQLKYRYDRLVAAQKQQVTATNAKVYTAAERACQSLFVNGRAGPASAPCIKSYVNTHLVKEQPIPEELYKFDFASPTWAPDIAGWSLVAALGLFILFGVRLGLEVWVKHDLRGEM